MYVGLTACRGGALVDVRRGVVSWVEGRTSRDVDVRVRCGPVPDGALAQRLGGAVRFDGVCVRVDLLFLHWVPVWRWDGLDSNALRLNRRAGDSRWVLNDLPLTVGSPLMAAVELVTTNFRTPAFSACRSTLSEPSMAVYKSSASVTL